MCSLGNPSSADSCTDAHNRSVNSDQGASLMSPSSDISPTLIGQPNNSDNSEIAHKTALLADLKEMQPAIKQVKAKVNSMILKREKEKNKNRPLNDVLAEINQELKRRKIYVVSACESTFTNLGLIPL
ncbi:hypothetical protein NDU88_001028 [Pleurodeles waltl]|uniref:Uncharacterized protein n=1 Tax=Pleurodeles waltl TaxID=8319 RepID=A0AAV7VY95_PLEWA|nr:hypothetical protein NDU88_001028 [Pleurodeles waltl]